MQRLTLAGMLICAITATGWAQAAREDASAVAESPTLLQTPTIFVENAGQFEAEVRFRTVMPWPSATVTDDGLVLTLLRHEESESATRAARTSGAAAGVANSRSTLHDDEDAEPLVGHNLRLRFVNASGGDAQHASPAGQEPSPTRCSYFFGNDPSRWVTDVPTWQTLRLREVSPGVSVDIHGRNGHLEYDLVVEPGADHDTTHVVIEGARSVSLLDDGSLAIDTQLGSIRQLPPVAWEVAADGSRILIESRVELLSGNRIAFQVADRSPERTLVIDPGLIYSTFIDGTGGESIEQGGLTVGDDGTAFLAGKTTSADFPVTPGAFQLHLGSWQDAYVLRLSADAASLQYATFLGGAVLDSARRIVARPNGELLVAGKTSSPDFPTTAGAYSPQYQRSSSEEGFALKLSPTGALMFSTLFPGSFTDMTVDIEERLVLVGMTIHPALPITPGAMQPTKPTDLTGFLVRMSPDGSAVDYCTYLGAKITSGVAVDSTMAMYATGYANSSHGTPVTAGAFQTAFNGEDAFVLKLTPSGHLQWCTLLGGSSIDRPLALSVNTMGQPTVGGFTESWNFPTTAGAFSTSGGSIGNSDGFATRFSADGGSLVWSTTIQAGLDDMAVDTAGNIHVVTDGASLSQPVTPNAFSTTIQGDGDSWVGKISADGSTLLYGTYFGSGAVGEPGGEILRAVAVDAQGDVYFAGYGQPHSNFPTTPGAFDPEFTGPSNTVFVAKIDLSTWQDVGHALPPWDGPTPRLHGAGSLQPGTPWSIHLDHGRSNSLCTLVLGLDDLNAPFKSGVLVPLPQLLVSLILTPQGTFDLSWPAWPAELPPGTQLWFQGWVSDWHSFAGFSASNGLTIVVPPVGG